MAARLAFEIPMKPHQFIAGLGALLMAIAIGLGAVGAHALKGALEKTESDPAVVAKALERWDTGVRYHMVEATLLVLGGITIAATGRSTAVMIAAGLAVVAITLFSGGLYAAAVTGDKMFTQVVPVGGVCAIASWVVFACRLFRIEKQ
jgi:uncharacterized membrane protein YgdD (TMEM256/DUF423 family)